MTRVAVFSDTHGSLSRLPTVKQAIHEIDAIIHLGDFSGDGQRLADEFQVTCYGVCGNCDFRSDLPVERVVEFENARIFITHGHRYRDLYQLSLKAEEQHCNTVLFGHTHIPLLTAQGKVLIVNPGSFSFPRQRSNPSCALLTINNNDVDVKLIPLIP